MLTGFRSLVASESKGSALVLPPMLEQIISTFQAMSTDQMKVLAHLCKCDLEQMMIVHDFMLSNNDLLELGDEALCEIITVVFLSIEKSDGRWLSRSNFNVWLWESPSKQAALGRARNFAWFQSILMFFLVVMITGRDDSSFA